MKRWEKPVADQLARQISAQGLTLHYLDCPRWDGQVPAHLVCRGYVDGLLARVRVLLAAAHGHAVDFDAELADGVIATRNLEDTLRQSGWTETDCGRIAAYPARAGIRIVCRVRRAAEPRFVVATVRDRAGTVTITDYVESSHSPTPTER